MSTTSVLQSSMLLRIHAGRHKGSSPGTWGYLVHIRACAKVLLMVDCPSLKALTAIKRHPVLHYLQQQSHRYIPQRPHSPHASDNSAMLPVVVPHTATELLCPKLMPPKQLLS